MKHITVGDQAIAVEQSGEGGALLLLHGLGADRRQTISALPAPVGHRAIYPDLPGHGDTPLKGEAGFARFAALAVALLDTLNIARAVIGGISMGAAIALRVALEHPERVIGLILIRPSWLDGPARPHLGIVERVGRWQAQEPSDAEKGLEADAEYQEIARNNPAAAESVRGLLTRPQALGSAAVLGAMVADRPFVAREALSGIPCKALVIANDGDPLHPVAIARETAAHLRGAQLQMVPSRYTAPTEHVAALRDAVQKFLDQLGES